jgi:uncharacterized protein (TIGR02996 family)
LNTCEEWYRLLERNHNDFEVRLVFADWLEEQGMLKEATGMRWQATNRQRAWKSGYDSWHWYNITQIQQTINPLGPESDLPEVLYLQLSRGYCNSPEYRAYHSIEEADDALADALEKVALLAGAG